MLDHLKQQRQAGIGARERTRLAILVGVLLLAGGVILANYRSAQKDKKPAEEADAAAETESVADGAEPQMPAQDAEPYDAEKLRALVAEDDAQPHRWSLGAFQYLDSIRRYGIFPGTPTATTPDVIEPNAPGALVQMEGRVVDRSQEAYQPPGVALRNATLWSLVVEAPGGGTFLVLSRGDSQREHGGAPEALAVGAVVRPVEVGDTILARGVHMQNRLGTIGETVLRESTPVVYMTAIRREVAADKRADPITEIAEAGWEDVRDLTLAETLRWNEDVIYQLIQWARIQGMQTLRDQIESGAIPWEEWDRDMFEQVWKKEVDPSDGRERTFTEGARGRLFRLDGIVADSVIELVPPNPWSVHDFGMLTILADDYRHVAVRFLVPFDLKEMGIQGRRKEHVRLYGLFVKNHTYRTRYLKPGTEEYRFLTVPMFVLLRADPHPGASESMLYVMYWVAAIMIILALAFYFVLVRGGRKQDEAMDERRRQMRKKRLAKTVSPTE